MQHCSQLHSNTLFVAMKLHCSSEESNIKGIIFFDDSGYKIVFSFFSCLWHAASVVHSFFFMYTQIIGLLSARLYVRKYGISVFHKVS